MNRNLRLHFPVNGPFVLSWYGWEWETASDEPTNINCCVCPNIPKLAVLSKYDWEFYSWKIISFIVDCNPLRQGSVVELIELVACFKQEGCWEAIFMWNEFSYLAHTLRIQKPFLKSIESLLTLQTSIFSLIRKKVEESIKTL